jgi:two-component system, OmpR family, phosphate regulon sensor histidine kinase PhoR
LATVNVDRPPHDSEFVSIASHELRTPISVVHGIAATLYARVGDLDEQQVRALLGALVQQTDRLRDLADQLLDLSRLEGGRLSGHAERFHPRERVEELLPRIAGDRLDDVWVVGDENYALVADAVAFERVAANLIVNALRYGEAPVVVRCESRNGFRLVVEDRGEGVEPGFVPHLFERFSRSDETRHAGALGAGLGLSIASSYASVLGGILRYEEAEPHGARFTLSLPAARS